jgi:hypothetical protein
MSLQLAAASYVHVHDAFNSTKMAVVANATDTNREAYSGYNLLTDLNFQAIGELFQQNVTE